MCSLSHRKSHSWFCTVLYSANKATDTKQGIHFRKNEQQLDFDIQLCMFYNEFYSLSVPQQHLETLTDDKALTTSRKVITSQSLQPMQAQQRRQKCNSHLSKMKIRCRYETPDQDQEKTDVVLSFFTLSSQTILCVPKLCSCYRREKVKTISNIQFAFICYIICWTPLQWTAATAHTVKTCSSPVNLT